MVQITLGNPADDVFTSAPKKPIKYEAFKNKMKALEEDGKHEAASTHKSSPMKCRITDVKRIVLFCCHSLSES
jgi:hypothetical protein